MPNKHSSQSIVPPEVDSVEAVDVGEISNAYPDAADRQAVHDAYERGNKTAAEKHEPDFDNRVGFADQFNTGVSAQEDALATLRSYSGQSSTSNQPVPEKSKT